MGEFSGHAENAQFPAEGIGYRSAHSCGTDGSFRRRERKRVHVLVDETPQRRGQPLEKAISA